MKLTFARSRDLGAAAAAEPLPDEMTETDPYFALARPRHGPARCDTLVIGFGRVSHDVVGPWVAWYGGHGLLVDRAGEVPALAAPVPVLDLSRADWADEVRPTVARRLEETGSVHVALLALRGCPVATLALPFVTSVAAGLAEQVVTIGVSLGDDARWPRGMVPVGTVVSRRPIGPPRDAAELEWRRRRASHELMDLLVETV